MRRVLSRAARLGATVVLAGAMCTLGPAAAAWAGAPADSITVTFADECGFYVKVTVTNTSASPVDYRIGVEDVDGTPFSIAAGATTVHHWPTYSGKLVVVTSAGLATAQEHDYADSPDCQAPDLDFDGSLTCESLMVLGSNEGEVATQVRVTRNGSVLGDLLDLPAGGRVSRIVPMAEGDVINLQRQTGGPDPQWVTILDGEYHADEACEGLPRVELTDTCTGVHVKTTNTLQTELVLEFGGLPPQGPETTSHTVAAGATFEQDFTLADKTVAGATWKQPRALMTVIQHSRPKTCSAGGGGGLPLTGAGIAMSAGAGVLLVIAGAGVYLLARRRRPVG